MTLVTKGVGLFAYRSSAGLYGAVQHNCVRTLATTTPKAEKPPDKRLDGVDFSQYPVYMVAIPITRKKAFIYSKHTAAALPNGKEGWEAWTIKKASGMWQKVVQSDNKANKKVVSWVNKLLWRVPWLETSMQSIPAKELLAGCPVDTSVPAEKGANTTTAAIGSDGADPFAGQRMPMFYPDRLIDPRKYRARLRPELPAIKQAQIKSIWRDVLLLPLTIPCILLPVIPNVPGFWLCYRAWCHYKAAQGSDNMQYLFNGHHLEPIRLASIDSVYGETSDSKVQANLDEWLERAALDDAPPPGVTHRDELLLAEDVAPHVAKKFGIPECTENLLIAIKQERAAIEKALEEEEEK